MRTRCVLSIRASMIVLTCLAPSVAFGEEPYLQPTFQLGGKSRVAVADIDHDGDLDWAGSGGKLLAGVAKNDGKGQFGTAAEIAMPNVTGGLEFGDMNGDGNVDLVVTTFSLVVVALGDGSGGFTIHSTLPFFGSLDSRIFAITDVTGDGKPDVLVGSSVAEICINDGTGGLATSHSVFGSNGYADFVLSDRNGDGIADIVGVGPDLAIFLGTGGGNYGPPIKSHPGGSRIALADLNLDGRLDAVVIDNAASLLRVLLGTAGGGFGTATSVPTAALPVGLVVRDLDGDGILDVATAGSTDHSVQVFRGNGGGFAAPITSSISQKPVDLTAGDWNGDGRLDLVVSASLGAVLLINPGGAPFFASDPTFTGAGLAIESIDVDLNGTPDLVTTEATGNTLGIYKGDGAGGIASYASVPALTQQMDTMTSLALGDVTGDGLPDAVIGAYIYGSGYLVRVMKGDGAGGFPSGSNYGLAVPVSEPISSFSIGDFDGDGLNDVAVTVEKGQNFMTLLGTPSGALVPGNSGFFTAYGMVQQTMGDVDNNGILDLAFVADGMPFLLQGQLFVCPGNGHNGFYIAANVNLGSVGLSDVTFADLDADGKLDVVATNSGQSLYAFKNLGLGAVAAPVIVPLGVGGGSPVHANTIAELDADGDGYDDVICLDDGALGLLRGNPQFALERRFYAAGGESVSGLCVYDGDLDGRPDIANFAASTYYVSPSRLVLHRNLLPKFFTAYGAGCPGSGNFVPSLALTGTATSNGKVKASLTKGLGGATAILVLGASHAHVPLGMGCFLLTSPLLPVSIALPLQGTGPGNGKLTLSAKLPTPAALGFLDFQAIVLDPGVPWGFCASNAVEMHVQ